MRPLVLRLENFTCFRGQTEPIDLSSVSLFAIAGPTGAGKSSLLDAMIFALYGTVPRVKKRVSALISAGQDRMSVVLDFEMRGVRYRVARSAHRKRGSQAQLDRLEEGGDKRVCDAVREVNAAVERLLGLGYEAFIQAVVLPQGEFARFLRSAPAERRAMLRELLRLSVFEDMRAKARARSARLETEVHHLDERLREDYTGASPEALEAIRAEAATADEAKLDEERSLGAERAALRTLRDAADRWEELSRCRTELARLADTRRAVEQQREQGRLARLAAPIMPLVAARERAEAAAREGSARAKDAAGTAVRRDEELAQAEAAVTSASMANDKAAALAERIRALDGVLGLLEPRDRARETARRGRERVEALGRERDAQLAAAGAAAEAKAAAHTRTEALEAEVSAIGYDAAEEARLEAVRELAAALTGARDHADRLRNDAADAATRLQEAETERVGADAALGEATRAWERARTARRDAEHADRVAAVRSELIAGEPCPVCEQRIPQLPAPLPVGSGEAAAGEAAAQGALDERRAAHAAATARIAAARESLARLSHDFEGARDTCRVAEADLAMRVGPIDGQGPVDDRIRLALERMVATRKAHREASAGLSAVSREHESAGHAHRRASERLADVRSQLAAANQALSLAERDLSDLELTIAGVTSAPDPQAERAALAARIEAERRALEAARTAGATARDAAVAARTAAEAAWEAASAAETARADAGQELQRAATAAGFDSPASVSAAAMGADALATLEAEVEGHAERDRATRGRIVQLEDALEGEPVGGEEVTAAETRLTEREKAYAAGVARAATLRAQAERLEAQLARASTLRERLAKTSAEHLVFKQLATDLRSERFQAYLMEETFRELVAGASDRLLALTGRYTLAFRDEGFWAIDHENARESRPTDTLSGGETFLCALSLALELSEQVQRAAGAVRLDSIFIDEGFGTLDPETLETVAGAIESLGGTGRTVGIITHIGALTDRLPSRIVVHKAQGGSTITVEHGAT